MQNAETYGGRTMNHRFRSGEPWIQWFLPSVGLLVFWLSMTSGCEAAVRSPARSAGNEKAKLATDLQSETRCSDSRPRKGVAELRWVAAASPGAEQKVVVTIFRDGFEKGKFESSHAFPSTQTSLTWENLSPGILYRWRVLTRRRGEWVPSETSTFSGPTCVRDYVVPKSPKQRS
jgi:hypothetical protein